MRKEILYTILLLSFIFTIPMSTAVAAEPGAKITGGIYCGWPAGLNLSAGIDTDNYGVNLSGMYYGKDESERFICNGIFGFIQNYLEIPCRQTSFINCLWVL